MKPLPSPSDLTSAEKVVPCLYFDTRDEEVSAKDGLVSAPGSSGICFQQRAVLPQGFVPPPGLEVDPDVGLFAAVAKTLESTAKLPNTFQAIGEGNTASVTVPVKQHSRRGVVLVFRRPAFGGVQCLIATTDPEVRNGSGDA